MPRPGRFLAVALLSAAALAYEILLVRIFAIEHFHHLAAMVISIAMLGFGASGTLLALAGERSPERAGRWFPWSSVLAATALLGSPAAAHAIPLDLTQLAWNPSEWLKLAAVYVLLALPFALASAAILLGIVLESGRRGAIYGANFVGSGLGAAAAVAVLWLALPVQALALPAVLGSIAAIAATGSSHHRGRIAAAGGAVALVALIALARPPWRLEVTPYKALPQIEAFPEARRVAERTSPLGWVTAVEAPAFRHAPGLSLAYSGPFPRQRALLVDGQLAGAALSTGDSSALEVLDWLPTALPYALEGRHKVLVLGAGGGFEVAIALRHGAREVTAVELHPDLVRLSGALVPQLARRSHDARVAWVIGDARNFVARSLERFDLVTIGLEGGFGTAAAGVHSLNEDFLHTVDAYVDDLQRLNDGGVLAITRWLSVPPREAVRVVLTAAEALRRLRPEVVKRGLVLVRSWGTVTVLVKPDGFRPQEIIAIADWAVRRRFDLDWYPGIITPTAGFNVLDEPTVYRAAEAAVTDRDSAAAFAKRYPFDIAPSDDSRPYPHHFLRARSLRSFFSAGTGAWLPFAEWGYIALVATVCQSALLAALFMVVPVTLRSRTLSRRWLFPLSLYFMALGLAYLAAEIAAIQQLSLLLGHPIYAVAAVLAAMLICSGLGSIWSDRLNPKRAYTIAAVLAVMLASYAVFLLLLVHLLQPAHLLLRGTIAFLALAPPALLMGVPFPIGLRAFAGTDTVRVAWAWAANGFASVVAAPLSAIIAIEAGSPALFVIAAAAYGTAALLLFRATRSSRPQQA